MSKLRCHISISADGFVAGPNQSEENALGEGGRGARRHASQVQGVGMNKSGPPDSAGSST
jgi:hypothetical protein